MKKFLLVTFFIALIMLVSCTRNNELLRSVTFGSLEEKYKADCQIVDNSMIGFKTLTVKESVFSDFFAKDGFCFISLNGKSYQFKKNVFIEDTLEVNIPDVFTDEQIEKAFITHSINNDRLNSAEERAEIEIQYVVIQKTASENGSNLYRIERDLFISMRNAGIFVFNGDTLIHPSYVISDEGNCYTLNTFLSARNASSDTSVNGTFVFLKNQANHGSLLRIINPNRVRLVNGQVIIDPPLENQRVLRDLGSEGDLSEPGNVYNITDNTPLGFWSVSIRPSRLPQPEISGTGWYLQVGMAEYLFIVSQFDSDLYETNVPDTNVSGIEAVRNTLFGTVGGNNRPIVQKVSGNEGNINQPVNSFSWTGSDSDGTVSRYEYQKDSGNWTNINNSTSYAWNGFVTGSHTFKVRAADNDGSLSEEICWTFNYEQQNTGITYRAVFVGIEDYGGGQNDLNYTYDDILDIETVIINQAYDYTIEKIGVRAEKATILAKLDEYIANTAIDSSDVFMFAFSGHGGASNGESYLYCSDGQGLTVTELKQKLDQIPGTKIISIDSCHSGGFTDIDQSIPTLQYLQGFNEVVINTFADESSSRGAFVTSYEYYVLAACAIDEYSYESSTIANGFYTFYHADGAGHVGDTNPSGTFDFTYNADTNSDGNLTLSELFDYTKTKVAEKSGNNQTVQVYPEESSYILYAYTQNQNVAPQIVKVSGVQGTTDATTATFEWSGSDSDGVIEYYEYKKDSENWTQTSGTAYIWNNFSEENEHTFSVRAVDDDESRSAIITWQFEYSTPGTDDLYEQDDDSDSAKEITNNETQHRVLADEDWIYFNLDSSVSATLTTLNLSGADTVMYLYNASMSQIDADDDSGPGYASTINRELPSGRYYVRIIEYGNLNTLQRTGDKPVGGSYSVDHTYDFYFEFEGQDDPYEQDDSADTAKEISRDEVQSRILADEDWVYFDLTENAEITIQSLNLNGADTIFYLYDSSMSNIASNDDGGEGSGSKIIDELDSGRYYLRIVEFGHSSQERDSEKKVRGSYSLEHTYDLKLEWETLVVDDNYEEDDDADHAKEIINNETQSRILADVDWAYFDLTDDIEITVQTLNLSGADTVIYLYNSSLGQIASNDDGGEGRGSLITRDLTSGRYYIKIREYGTSSSERTTDKPTGGVYSSDHTYDLKLNYEESVTPDGTLVLIDDMHNNSGGLSGKLNDFMDILEQQGYSYQMTSDTNFQLDNACVLITIMPLEAYTTAEYDEIVDFVNDGGSMMLLGELGAYADGNSFSNNLLNRIGSEIRLNNDSARDDEDGYQDNYSWVKGNEFVAHDITAGLSTVISFAGCTVNAGGSSQPVIYFTDTAYSVAYSEERIIESADVNDIHDDGVLTNRDYRDYVFTAVEEVGAGRLLVCGDTGFIKDQTASAPLIDAEDDREFVINAINWLVDGEFTPISDDDPYEEDDSSATAKSISDDQQQSRILADEDWIYFDVTNQSEITLITLNLDGADTVLYLYDSSNALIASNDDYNGRASRITKTLSSGRYYARVVEYGNSTSERDAEKTARGDYSSNHTYDIRLDITAQEVQTDGMFKIANSWGVGGWENVDDGFYYMTYDCFVDNVSYVYVADKGYTETRAIALFRMDHDVRSDCDITVGVGDPDNPDRRINFSGHAASFSYKSGAEPYPDNLMTLDITPLLPIQNEDIFIRIFDDSENTATGTLEEFMVEVYNSYDSSRLTRYTSLTVPVNTVNGQTVSCIMTNKTISAFSERTQPDKLFTSSRRIEENEFEKIKNLIGTAEEYKDYNQQINGFGTGYRPPTEAEWETISRTTQFMEIEDYETKDLPRSYDNSVSQYFPPIGNQGSKGSCSSFATGYYTGTYYNARRYNWNLTNAEWVGGYTGGIPSTYDQYIMSPDFLYTQLNQGTDHGSSIFDNIHLMHLVGIASFEKMPYDLSNITEWGNEAAWRDAPKHRLDWKDDWVFTYLDRYPWFYMEIDSADDVDVIKALLADGYLVNLSIDGNQFANMTSEDVWNINNYHNNGTNHANTIVGFVDE
ncbi:MAG TPA: pre-peptidase C-terminal domain-containing protein [Thermotogota bacterium]|nr:pre-peptidase C-terminal domain-containing protein [Thermotogota bacterium]